MDQAFAAALSSEHSDRKSVLKQLEHVAYQTPKSLRRASTPPTFAINRYLCSTPRLKIYGILNIQQLIIETSLGTYGFKR